MRGSNGGLAVVCAGVAVALMVGCSAMPLGAQAPAVAAGTSPGTAGGVRAGDMISVWVWRETTLTGEFPVDARGRAVLPMIGDIVVTGKSSDALVDEIQASFRKFLTNPSIRVSVVRRVAVQGQVGRPGLYPVDATVTIGNVIAMAGGVSPNGDPRKIRLLRDGRVIETSLGTETVLERSAVQSGDEIFVAERPWLSRQSGMLFGAGLSVVTGVVVALLLR
jgi:polysaccharide export outer membrane protein